ncbi:MAG: tetratricopeptide repeat protein [Phycisphaerales bacterium]
MLKAIAKDPGERYRSAIELLADVERWRRHEPVAAAPDSASYRAGKFLRRHRAGVALASAAVLALAGGVVAAGMGYWRANAARHAETEQRLAAQQIGDFLDDMLGSIDPNDARDRDTALVREVLDKASRRLTEVSAMSPSVRMPLERRVGESYAAIWELDAARDHLERARTLVDELGWQDTLEAGEVAHWLGFLANAEGRLPDAHREVERGLEIRRHALAPDDPKLGESLSLLGAILMEQARYDEARPVIEESVSIWRRHRGAHGLTTLNDSTKLAGILLELGKNAEAISVLESIHGSLDDADRVSPAGAAVFNMLGIAYKRAGDLERAEGVYAEALDVSRKVFGEDHPGTLTVRGNLANVIENLGRVDEAKREQLAVLESRERALGERHPDTITSLGNLTLLCSKRGEHDEAIEYGRRATRLSSEVFGDANPNAAMCRGGLGIALKNAGGEEHLLEAERHLRQCYQALAAALGADHPATRRTRETLAELYGPDALDRPDELAKLRSAPTEVPRDAVAGPED